MKKYFILMMMFMFVLISNAFAANMTKRVHKSLNKKTPMQFIIEKEGMSQKSLSHTQYGKI